MPDGAAGQQLQANPGLRAHPVSDRGFWLTFAAGWLAYMGLFVSVGTLTEGMSLTWALAVAGMNAGPPAVLAVLVAARRRVLLRPERTLGRTSLVLVLTGLAYALATSLVVTAIAAVFDFEEAAVAQASLAAAIFYRMVAAGFLYAVLAGFLMWSESLRRVHESRSMAAREAELRARAEANALRAQFNPHFVFNTLHSLMLLVRADPAAAERAIEDVATLIRYASIVQRSGVDTVPLTKEVEVARRYVALEKLRLEDRLAVSWQVEVDAASHAVPSFALQTLIENAIKHGIEPCPAGGEVSVTLRESGGVLMIEVADDGAGAHVAGVLKKGHGLFLLSARLESIYGSAASLEWQTEPGGGFHATVRVPAAAPAAAPFLEVITEGAV